MPPVKLPPRPKQKTRYIGILFPIGLLDRVLSERRSDENVSAVIRRLCDERLNGGKDPQKVAEKQSR